MKILSSSFRFKIIISLIFVVASISFVAFYIFNSSLSKILHKDHNEQVSSVMHILKDQFYYTLSFNDKEFIYSLLDSTQNSENVYNAYLLNSEGKVVYPGKFKSITLDSLSMGDSSVYNEHIEIKSFETEDKHFTRAFIQMQNSQKCYECHSPTEEILGYIVIDFSMEETEKSLVFVQKFTLFFTISMVLAILGIIMIMHYRVVRKSLSHFESSINIINQGNLGERVVIRKSKELGVIAEKFNEMVDKFQKTQKQLQSYHQKELLEKHKLATIGEMAAKLAHEIRNPLTGIDNAIEMLVMQMPEGDQNKHVMEEIRRQAKRVNHAISNMLRFSRTTDLKSKQNDINETIKAMVFFIKNQVQNKKIEFIKDFQVDIPLFPFDREQIENVLLNLVLNAIQAIPEKGTITFKTVFNPENRNVLITVKDTGVGISSDILENIFTPFFTNQTEGIGLGLAIAKEIVEKHKGKIRIESEESKGSVFYISLPFEQ